MLKAAVHVCVLRVLWCRMKKHARLFANLHKSSSERESINLMCMYVYYTYGCGMCIRGCVALKAVIPLKP